MGKIKVLNIGDLDNNQSKVVNVEDKDESLSEGEVYDCKVECPAHGAEFDLKTGEALPPPASKGVTCYQTTTDENSIYIEVEKDA